MSTAYQCLCRWRDIGDTYVAGDKEHAADVIGLLSEYADLLEALKTMMEQPTMSPLSMTPEQRRALWAAHDKARAAIAKAEGPSDAARFPTAQGD